jgi:hypothetical protein
LVLSSSILGLRILASASVNIVVVGQPTTTTIQQRFCKTQPDEVITTTFAKAALLVHNYYAE